MCPGCSQSLAGKRADARFCTHKCEKRAKRLAELGLDAWPEPTAPKPLATATHCRNGHAWAPESHRIAKDGSRKCLLCRRARMPDTCKQGHAWIAENTRIGSKGQRVCITCVRSSHAQWKRDNPDKVREEQRRRRAANPEWGEQSRESARQWRANNLEAALENARRWREENPDRVRESYRTWAAANPEARRVRDNARRARKAQATICGPLTARVYAGVISSGPCVYCGEPAAEVDHVRPLARGGVEHSVNLVPACKSCNSGKKDRLLDEWDQARVTRAVRVSSVVRSEWDRMQSGQEALF